MNNAEPDAVCSDDYMAQHDMVYRLNAEERAYCHQLTDFGEELSFLKFLAGAKLRQFDGMSWHEWYPMPLDELGVLWEGARTGEGFANIVNGHIHFGMRQMDPRYDDANYRLGATLARHCDSLRPFTDDHFRQYVMGRKVACDRHGDDPAFENEILEGWNRRDRDDILSHRQIGRKWYKRRHPAPILDPAGTHHFYIAESLPDPTQTDHTHVNYESLLAGGGEWRFERTIYQNPHRRYGNGYYRRIVHLFTRIDDFGRVVDKVIVKVQGEDSAEDVRENLFREFNIQAELNEAGSQHILEARTASYRERTTPPETLGYIYLDWAPFGTVLDLIEDAPHGIQFPEPLLWLIFRGLAEALHVEYTGLAVARDHPPLADSTLMNHHLPRREGWESLVNTDIKLGNVVLNHSQTDYYPAYKTVQLIDFGCTKPESFREDPLTKREGGRSDGEFLHIATDGCRPPEQLCPPHDKYTDFPLSILSDTWNVGQIMFQLMERREVDAYSPFFEFDHPPDYSHVYSFALEDLVARCVQIDPDERPEINDLLYKTKMGLRNWQTAYVDVSRSGEEVDDKWTWKWRKEWFPVGVEVPRHWGWRRREWIGEDDSDDDDGGSSTRSSSDSDDPYGEKEERFNELFEGSSEEESDESDEEESDEEENDEEESDEEESEDEGSDDEYRDEYKDEDGSDEDGSDEDRSDGDDGDGGDDRGDADDSRHHRPVTRAVKKANISRAVSALIREERANALSRRNQPSHVRRSSSRTNTRAAAAAATKSNQEDSNKSPAHGNNTPPAQASGVRSWMGPSRDQYRHTFEVWQKRMQEQKAAREEVKAQAGLAAKIAETKVLSGSKNSASDWNSGTYEETKRQMMEKKKARREEAGKKQGGEVEKRSETQTREPRAEAVAEARVSSGSKKRSSAEREGSSEGRKRRRAR